MSNEEFTFLCRQVRKDIVEMYLNFSSGHLSSSLSIVEILVTLYHYQMNRAEDQFVLSKGHGCLALYSILGRLEYFPKSEWTKIGRPTGILGGHPTSGSIPGIHVSSGSLGLSPSVCVGLALGAKLKKNKSKIFCLLGDGECNEGSVWEAAMAAAHKQLDNLCFLIDCNGYQAFGKTERVCNLEPMAEKWLAFGWKCMEVDLIENPSALLNAMMQNQSDDKKPKVFLCRTKKGMGIPAIENDPQWHHKNKLSEQEKKLLQEFCSS